MKEARKRIIINRTNRGIYAQCVDNDGRTIVGRKFVFKSSKTPVEQSQTFGNEFGKIVISKKIEAVSFDRNDHLYHGRVKAFAKGLREAGLKF